MSVPSEHYKYQDLLLESDDDFEPYGTGYTSDDMDTGQTAGSITEYDEHWIRPGGINIKA